MLSGRIGGEASTAVEESTANAVAKLNRNFIFATPTAFNSSPYNALIYSISSCLHDTEQLRGNGLYYPDVDALRGLRK